ncbi:MAG: BMP family ABC transporter substrate-binding protein, partial [Clostridiales bacterium]|nr:BMP family ABC transporter substrate-binding protein [Clostridiales bacterium]
MKVKRLTAAFMATVLALSLCSCGADGGKSGGKNSGKSNTSAGESVNDLKIGVLYDDAANANCASYYQKQGIMKAAEELKLDSNKIIEKIEVTNVYFDANDKFSLKTTDATNEKDTKKADKTTAEAKETTAVKDETTKAETTAKATAAKDTTKETKAKDTKTTTAKAKDTKATAAKAKKEKAETTEKAVPTQQAVTLPPVVHETALDAVRSLVNDKCNVIIMTSRAYKNITEYLAPQLEDVIFIQYGTVDKELDNLLSYTDRMYEALYVEGAAAAKLSKSGNLGYIATVASSAVKDNVNAFYAGAASINKKASVFFTTIDTNFDLVLETTKTEALIKKNKCDVIAQNVYTALPQVAAEKAKKYCFGFGYDMSSDAPKFAVSAAIWNWDVYFTQIFKEIKADEITSKVYSGGIKEGLVGLSAVRIDNDAVNKVVDKA